MATVPTIGPSDKDRRKSRYAAGDWLRSRSVRTGARSCMHALPGFDVEVGATAAGATHLSGVQRCASPWACPYCSPVIAETRSAKIDAASARWTAAGGSIFFVTATLSHKYGDDLGDLLDMVQASWSATFRFGRNRPDWYGGQIRAVEVTHGDKGWHPHIHAAIFVNPGHDIDKARNQVRSLGADFQQAVADRGGNSMASPVTAKGRKRKNPPGWDVRDTFDSSGFAKYLTKVKEGWGLGLEIAAAYRKSGHKAGRTHFQLLADAMAGDNHSLVLFNIYERATSGRRAIVATPGLMTEPEPDDTDELDQADAVAEVVEPIVYMLLVPGRVWKGLLRTGGAAQLLEDVSLRARGKWPPAKPWEWPEHWTIPAPAVA